MSLHFILNITYYDTAAIHSLWLRYSLKELVYIRNLHKMWLNDASKQLVLLTGASVLHFYSALVENSSPSQPDLESTLVEDVLEKTRCIKPNRTTI